MAESALGKGLDALFSSVDIEETEEKFNKEPVNDADIIHKIKSFRTEKKYFVLKSCFILYSFYIKNVRWQKN